LHDAQRSRLAAGPEFCNCQTGTEAIEKLKMKLPTKSQIEFGQARYQLIVVEKPIVIPVRQTCGKPLLLCVRVL